MDLIYGTPVEPYQVGRASVRVKRDDLASAAPAPCLGKMRGMRAIIETSGARTIGAVDRSPSSRNSWGNAWLCKEMGLRCVAFYGELGPNQQRAVDLGADGVLLPGLAREELYQEAQFRFYHARDFVHGGTSYFMPPDDCHARELVQDAEDEVLRTGRGAMACTDIVIPVGSGGMAVGILRGLVRLQLSPNIHLHLGGSRRSKDYVEGVLAGAGVRRHFDVLRIVDGCAPSGNAPSQQPPPFPCNVTYEMPAWDWMVRALTDQPRMILFWNAGA